MAAAVRGNSSSMYRSAPAMAPVVYPVEAVAADGPHFGATPRETRKLRGIGPPPPNPVE